LSVEGAAAKVASASKRSESGAACDFHRASSSEESHGGVIRQSTPVCPTSLVAALAHKMVEVAREPGRLDRMARHNLETAHKYSDSVLAPRRREFLKYLHNATQEWTNCLQTERPKGHDKSIAPELEPSLGTQTLILLLHASNQVRQTHIDNASPIGSLVAVP
jgi:hypothetical protein